MNALIQTLIQIFLVLTLAPFSIGFARWCKARLQNRRGASPIQPYWALAALCKKEMTVSRHTSWVFPLVPVVFLGTIIFLVLSLPLSSTNTLLAGSSNIFLVTGVLLLGAAFLVLGGMDVASTFGAMGASREMTLSALIEPVFLLVLLTLAHATGDFTVSGIVSALINAPLTTKHIFLLPTIMAFAGVILAENARYPVDNPATHLELTMIHEAMVLEYSGPWLAMLEYAAALKLTVFALLFMNIVFPFALTTSVTGVEEVVIAAAALVVKLSVAMFLIALLETGIAKMRWYRMQEFTMTLYLLALLGFFLMIIF